MPKRKTVEEFISAANIIHNNKYLYNKVKYINSITKVLITCSVHNDFLQEPKKHLKGHGCSKCTSNYTPTNEEFIDQAKIVHGDKYEYSKVQYKNTDTKVTIACKQHGTFTQTPHAHLSGKGCPECANTKKTTKEFIKIANEVHDSKYTYEKTNYINTVTKVIITCSKHGDWEQTPNAHTIKKQGCPYCAVTGFDITKPAILYYLKINGGQAYKIGITNRTVTERFSNSELQVIEVLKTWYYSNGQEAYNKEQEILKKYKKYKYKGQNLLQKGNTELFNKDILNLH